MDVVTKAGFNPVGAIESLANPVLWDGDFELMTGAVETLRILIKRFDSEMDTEHRQSVVFSVLQIWQNISGIYNPADADQLQVLLTDLRLNVLGPLMKGKDGDKLYDLALSFKEDMRERMVEELRSVTVDGGSWAYGREAKK